MDQGAKRKADDGQHGGSDKRAKVRLFFSSLDLDGGENLGRSRGNDDGFSFVDFLT